MRNHLMGGVSGAARNISNGWFYVRAGLLYMCGSGPCRIEPPPGSRCYKLEESPSGHRLLPVDEMPRVDDGPDSAAPRLTLPVEADA